MYRNAFFHYLASALLSVYITSLPLSCCCQRNYYEFGMKNFCHECKVLKLIRLLMCMIVISSIYTILLRTSLHLPNYNEFCSVGELVAFLL